MNLQIFFVDGSAPHQPSVAALLASFGHRVQAARSGADVTAIVGRHSYDIIVIGGHAGGHIGLLHRLRDAGEVLPVLLLTADNRLDDRLEAFAAGADDVVTQSIDPLELNARLQALVRGRRLQALPADIVRAGDIRISPSQMQAWRGGHPLSLTRNEFRLLLELARHGGHIVGRPLLIERVWGSDGAPHSNIVDGQIRYLRAKLKQYGDDPITTVRHMGYVLRA